MPTSFEHGRLSGARHGDGDPWVLALPGWLRTHSDFDDVLGRAGDPVDSIVLDLPGSGATPPPPIPWGSAEYARVVAPVLNAMTRFPVVIGHSFGGRVAVHLAAAYPERVGALVLTGVPLFRVRGSRGNAPPGFRLARRLNRMKLVPDGLFEGVRHRYGSEEYRQADGVMRGVLERVMGEKYVPMLKVIRCPVELVWGDRDTAAPLGVAEMIQAELRHVNLTVLRGVGHMTPLDAPDALRVALERYRP
jgi:pimeloyl-ACP methyl ester carboxylesterase